MPSSALKYLRGPVERPNPALYDRHCVVGALCCSTAFSMRGMALETWLEDSDMPSRCAGSKDRLTRMGTLV